VAEIRNRQFQSISGGVPSANYSIFDDLDGNGVILGSDVGAAQNRQFTQLPAGEPAAPGAGAGIGSGLEVLASGGSQEASMSPMEVAPVHTTQLMASSISTVDASMEVSGSSNSQMMGQAAYFDSALVLPFQTISQPVAKASIQPTSAVKDSELAHDLALLCTLDSRTMTADATATDDISVHHEEDGNENMEYAAAVDSAFDDIWAA